MMLGDDTDGDTCEASNATAKPTGYGIARIYDGHRGLTSPSDPRERRRLQVVELSPRDPLIDLARLYGYGMAGAGAQELGVQLLPLRGGEKLRISYAERRQLGQTIFPQNKTPDDERAQHAASSRLINSED